MKSDLKIELGGASTHLCSCCGERSETVHGYLYKPDGETSVYFAGYAPSHSEKRVNLLLSVGGWGEGTNPGDRQAIAMEAKREQGDVAFTFQDPESSPWFGEEFLGAMRQPEDMSNEERERFMALSATAAALDPRVAAYLASSAQLR